MINSNGNNPKQIAQCILNPYFYHSCSLHHIIQSIFPRQSQQKNTSQNQYHADSRAVIIIIVASAISIQILKVETAKTIFRIKFPPSSCFIYASLFLMIQKIRAYQSCSTSQLTINLKSQNKNNSGWLYPIITPWFSHCVCLQYHNHSRYIPISIDNSNYTGDPRVCLRKSLAENPIIFGQKTCYGWLRNLAATGVFQPINHGMSTTYQLVDFFHSQ